ncbi:LOW QUALITY PROTEIN: uncharacterized protein LOC122947404 [Acropora millepora]|uniref:LOW QUALITY PROTEIN: uncharacterized protein LOC122947404 n=1 Tax=Acropora millepora TaxID=45264 RepID=UPI001CF54954|nr:LOW QUALITY PROTEIN: uncharacterized protein LOC122947404 [Acropora millepora]
MSTLGSSFPGASGSFSQEATKGCASLISSRKLKVTLLSSEWGSTKGGLSTINRELAIQLAKNDNVEVSMYLPLCSEEDERAAAEFRVHLLKAKKKPGYDPIDWLASVPKDHHMDVVIGHGIRLGRQVLTIKEFCPGCKWIQVVHTDPEELAMFKDYADPTVKGAKKHQAEVELCELADQVVAVGPKLTEAFACYLRSCGKDQDVINLTPGIFSEFTNINQAAKERETFRVLVFGRGDSEDFLVKGYDIAARAVAMLKDEERSFKLVFVGAPDGEEDKVKERFLEEGILPSQLIVRSAKERDELAKQFYEADLVMMPSRTEGFGLAALEALSAGLPVLVSGNSGVGKALKKVLYGSYSVVNSEEPKKWAKAIRTICSKERELRLREAIFLRQSYAETYQWEGQCSTLVEKMLEMIKETSTAPDQADAAVNLGEQGPSSVSHPDATRIHHIVGDAVSSGRENVFQRERPRTHPLTTTERRQRLNAGIPEISQKRQSAEKQGKRPALAHLSGSPPGKKQRRDTDTFRVFNDNSVIVKLLRAEYNRRAQLRPLLWESTIQLPLEKVYTRLKIVSRRRGGNQGETKRWSDVIWAEDSRRDATSAEARANKANPCDVFAMLKENKDVMTIVEGSPGIGKTTFCLKLAYDWANQSSSAVSFPEFELVLLLKCRDVGGDLTEAITEQLFPKDLSKDAREELLRFLEDIENQERVLIILDGLDELAEKSKHYVDDLLHRKRWACCYVLATTRQEKGIEVRKQPEFVFNLFLQIEGFTEEDSFEYIRRHFKIAGPEHSSKGEKLIEEIKENELLRDLQENPLNLLLLCIVYQDHEGKLPSSRTNLYQVIVVCLLKRYCARHNVKASKEDMDLEKQFKRDILCLGELAWNCLLNDRHSFFEEQLEELERRNEKLVARRLGFVYKEESLKVLKPQHEYCFLHKSFQEFLAASYVAHKLRRKKLNVFEHLDFDAVVNKFPQVFVFVCGILREEASILFAQIGEKLKSDWDWLKCSNAAADFFIKSWSESGNAEDMANTVCLFLPFPLVVTSFLYTVGECHLLRVLLFCRRFSKVEVPDEIKLEITFLGSSIGVRDLASLPNLKSLDISDPGMGVSVAHELFEILPDCASLTELALPDVPEMTDWGIVAKALTTSKTLETVGCTLLGERGKGWARALDAGLCADTPLSSVDLTICGPMSETALQALENLLLNKSLSSVSVIVEGDMSHSLAVTLSRALAGETAVKSLDLSIFGKLSFFCANLIERGIVKNNSLCKLKVCVERELPDNWQAIVENLNVRLTEKSTVTFEIYPNTFSQVTATQMTDVRPCVMNYGFFKQESVTLNVWGELTVDGAKALYNVLPCSSVCHLTLNIHGKLTDDFLHCTARHVDKQKPLCPITINTWDQLTNEEKALFKDLELDKNPAVTLNVCDKRVPSDESGDNKIVSIDDPASLIALLKEEETIGKESVTVTINVQSDDSTGRSWNDSLPLVLARNCSLTSLTLTINNFSPRSTELSLTLIGCLEGCSSLKSLTLTLNEYNEWKKSYPYLLCKGLGRNTSLVSLSLTLNIYTRVREVLDIYNFQGDGRYVGCFVPNISINSFTLTVNDFSWGGPGLGVGGDVLLCSYESLTTLNVTLNHCSVESFSGLPCLLVEEMKPNSLKTLRLKINDLKYRIGCREYDFSDWVVKIPSLELLELTIIRYGVVGSWVETLKWEKQR